MAIHPLAILQGIDPVRSEDPIKKAGNLESLAQMMRQGLIQDQQIATNQDAASTRQSEAQADQDAIRIMRGVQIDPKTGSLDPATEAALAQNGSARAQKILASFSTIAGQKSNIKRDTALTEQAGKTFDETVRHNTAIETEANRKNEMDEMQKAVEIADKRNAPAKPDLSTTAFEAWQRQNPDAPIADWLKLTEKATAAASTRTRAVNTLDASGNPVTKIVPDVAGSEFPDQPTSTQRDRDTSLKNIDPVMKSISDLSEKINTGKGLIAKAAGGANKVLAEANYNDDVAEYEALIAGFTPMVARAVGHTGVLTQQDVDSVKALFPRPGDSKTLRDRKIARVKFILGIGGDSPSPAPQQTQPKAGGAPKVGDVKKFLNGKSGKWDGQGWVLQ